MARYGLEGRVLGACQGAALELVKFRHPFYDRESPVYLGDYVTLDAGTGVVHSAPAYGLEDFESCKRHGMRNEEIHAGAGRRPLCRKPAFLRRQNVWKANKTAIIEKIREVGCLFASPRSPTATCTAGATRRRSSIRATSQWFVGMDRQPVRGTHAARDGAVSRRGDEVLPRLGPGAPACHDRQPSRLVRLAPAQLGRADPLLPAQGNRRAASAHARNCSNRWRSASRRRASRPGSSSTRPSCSATRRRTTTRCATRSMSGSIPARRTGRCCAAAIPTAAKWPADLYLEGSDQHRGWFHSSLLTGCALDGRAPYDGLLTHGFVVDGQGHKMSKSKGNVIVPQKVSDTLGAEVLRLWVAATDYSGELSISDEILKRVVESYRRIRNTLRFLLANTADFDPARDMLPPAEWLEIDRYALALTRRLQEQVTADYGRYEFHRVVQALQGFCSEELGAFYLDILKDRLYTTATNSKPRCAAQSALWHILQALTRLMAPVLTFTAEEIWQILTKNPDDSVMLATWHALPEQAQESVLLARWQQIREVRAEVSKVLEELRVAGKIGSSLQAEVEIRASGAKHDLLASLGNDLRLVLICSKATLVKVGDAAAESVAATPSPHAKCPRCWHWREDVGVNAEHPELCGRCDANLHGAGEPRSHA
jgi:isoleucyl-tRNA synthetase